MLKERGNICEADFPDGISQNQFRKLLNHHARTRSRIFALRYGLRDETHESAGTGFRIHAILYLLYSSLANRLKRLKSEPREFDHEGNGI